MQQIPLIGKTLDELKTIVLSFGMPTYTATQLAEWLYKKQVFSIEEMTNISKQNRDILNERYCVGRNLPVHFVESSDGTKKYLFETTDNHFVETVYIPEDDRATLCISSQVGCKMNCKFCMTGKQGFSAQLSAAEILNQFISVAEAKYLTNIVFMGMGEPFDNTQEVLKSIEILTADYGFAWSPRRITVSTIGLLPGLQAFLENSQAHLAISLHSPFANERENLMPIEKTYPTEKILAELKKYDFSKQRRLSFEYIMFSGLNDSMRHAIHLSKVLKGIACRVNLIRFHAIPGVDFSPSEDQKMIEFRNYLSDNGIICTIRKSRGEDIQAACGMLSTSEKEKMKANTTKI